MLKIRKFKETDLEFSELARIDNLVNHDSIDHPDDDKRDWNLRDKNLVSCLLYTSPSPRDGLLSRMPSSA